jgi:putative membrane protein
MRFLSDQGEMMPGWYQGILVAHIVAVISWMAGLLYLPRLFVYHCGVPSESETSLLFRVMERRLLHAITIPAAVATWIFGGMMVSQWGLGQGWVDVKLILVIFLTAYTAVLEKWRRGFAAGQVFHSERFFRIVNEIPAILMIFIVAMVVLKPF